MCGFFEEEDVLTARAILKEPLWGYDVTHANGEMRIRMRPAPPSGSGADMAGLHIWLDPGHGGASNGALGATGLAEREANLRLALALEKRLQALGATVSLGRRTDKAVSLEDRIEEALENHADLFLSLHCNAVADTTDPLSVRGPSVHYYHGLSQWLAESLTASLAANLKSLDIPNYGLVRNNLFVTRESIWFPAALVEFCFISHPGDEELLVSDEGIHRLTQSVVDGLQMGLLQRDPETNAKE